MTMRMMSLMILVLVLVHPCAYMRVSIYICTYTCNTRNTYSYHGNSSSWLQQLCLNTLIDSGGPQLSIPAGHPMTHGFSAALTP